MSQTLLAGVAAVLRSLIFRNDRCFMPLRDIITYPDPRLREKCALVCEFNAALRSLINDMALTMYAAGGIGLAASQVAVLQQVAVVDVSSDQKERLTLVNPRIVWKDGDVPSEEGCLSIPDFRDTIKRSERIVLQAQDESGKEFELEASGILAICIQHEVDHLQGVLFIDHLSRLKREFFKKWHRKRSEEA